MGYVTPSFPNSLWNGLTPNPDRTNRAKNVDPNFDDYDVIAAELIAVQEFLLGTPPGSDELFSLYSAPADMTISGGLLVRVQPSGKIILADSDTSGLVSGVTMTSGTVDNPIVYVRQGRIVSTDWSAATGSNTLIPGQEYFLTNNGQMNLIPPPTGYVVKLGQSQSETAFDLDIQPAIKL